MAEEAFINANRIIAAQSRENDVYADLTDSLTGFPFQRTAVQDNRLLAGGKFPQRTTMSYRHTLGLTGVLYNSGNSDNVGNKIAKLFRAGVDTFVDVGLLQMDADARLWRHAGGVITQAPPLNDNGLYSIGVGMDGDGKARFGKLLPDTYNADITISATTEYQPDTVAFVIVLNKGNLTALKVKYIKGSATYEASADLTNSAWMGIVEPKTTANPPVAIPANPTLGKYRIETTPASPSAATKFYVGVRALWLATQQ